MHENILLIYYFFPFANGNKDAGDRNMFKSELQQSNSKENIRFSKGVSSIVMKKEIPYLLSLGKTCKLQYYPATTPGCLVSYKSAE